jgi:hypothetical protein
MKNIGFVETHISDRNKIINDIAVVTDMGNHMAGNLVNKWFEDFSSFIYDKTNGELIAYLYRTRGYWEVNAKNLMNYKV